jgi:hypothetical protein
VTRFWYTLKNLHPIILIHGHVIIDDMGSYLFNLRSIIFFQNSLCIEEGTIINFFT